jgi:hypothetical protein
MGTTRHNFTEALEAIGNLTSQGLDEIFTDGVMAGRSAHTEIKATTVTQKTSPFYRHLLLLRRELVAMLTDKYRRYFKVAVAHPREARPNPDQWARSQLQPTVDAVVEWIRNWYILACDGENQYVRKPVSVAFVPGQTVSVPIALTDQPSPPPESWRAPAWLFEVSLPLVGIGPLREQHVPARDSEENLGAAHTRLLLKGARRVFLWELGAAIETVRNEETAAAGAIPGQVVGGDKRGPNKRKGWEQRLKLYKAVRNALSANPSVQGMEFCAELDKRHAPPLYDWMKRGEWREGLTWREAWHNRLLRRRIRRVRQEAMRTVDRIS